MADALRSNWRVGVLLLVLALLPLGRLSELPILFAALSGLVLLLRGRIDLADVHVRLGIGLFIAYWLPQLVSAADAINPQRAWTEVAADLRFLPFLLFAMDALRDRDARRRVLFGSAAMLALFCADALIQAATGWSLGGVSDPERLSGVFGADNLKLGLVLAVMSPLLLLPAQQRFGMAGLMLAGAALLIVVFLAGARAGWLMLGLAFALALYSGRSWRRATAYSLLAVVTALAVGGIAASLSPGFNDRIERSAAIFSGDQAGLNHALSGRLPIWDAAVRMGEDHPINGVGVRGFREAYPAYAAADDPWVSHGETALHAHQLLLELWAETGAIGLLCWLLAAAAAIRYWHRLMPSRRESARAPAHALAVMLFPLNTHLAFYSSFWGIVLFLLLALWLGCSQSATAPAERPQ